MRSYFAALLIVAILLFLVQTEAVRADCDEGEEHCCQSDADCSGVGDGKEFCFSIDYDEELGGNYGFCSECRADGFNSNDCADNGKVCGACVYTPSPVSPDGIGGYSCLPKEQDASPTYLCEDAYRWRCLSGCAQYAFDQYCPTNSVYCAGGGINFQVPDWPQRRYPSSNGVVCKDNGANSDATWVSACSLSTWSEGTNNYLGCVVTNNNFCEPAVNGDVVETREACRAGANGDYFDSSCQGDYTVTCTVDDCAQPNFACNPATLMCEETQTCDNGITEGSEQCDLGGNNGQPGYCCTSSCTLVPAGTACGAGSCQTCNAAGACGNVAAGSDPNNQCSTGYFCVGNDRYNGDVCSGSGSCGAFVETCPVSCSGGSCSATWYRDADSDSFGNPSISQVAAARPAGYVGNRNDCNDGNGAIYPGQTEFCTNEIDDDCDGIINEGCTENSLAYCNDADIDNDQDGRRNFADAHNPAGSLNVNVGQSCNRCNLGMCALAGGIPANPTCAVAQPPAAGGVEYFDGATVFPGNAGEFRLDCDGSALPSACWCQQCSAGYGWDGTSCVSLTPPQCLNPADAPQITSFAGTPATGYALDSITLTLQGTAAYGPVTYEIDTNENAASYEVSGGSSPTNAVVNNVAAGSHTYYARITDSCPTPRSTTGQVTVLINPNPAPVINAFTSSITPLWLGKNVTYTINASDNRGNFWIYLDFGDGTFYSVMSPGTSWSGTVTHTYGQGPYTAALTITDSGSPVLTAADTEVVTGDGLECVQGTQDGNPTYSNEQAQCCTTGGLRNPSNYQTCPARESGWWGCFAVTACYPDSRSICSSNPAPTDWRDRDTDQAHCEASSASCTQYTWTTAAAGGGLAAPLCCGDDGGENLALWSFGAPAACCNAPNRCYTTAGASPGCYNPGENTAPLCRDGNDNDCDGAVDGMDPDCQPTLIYGRVTANDQGSPSIVVDGEVSIAGVMARKQTDATGNYSFTGADLAGATIDDHNIFAYKFGYSTDNDVVAFAPGAIINKDFELQPRRCNADCTNDQGFCDASCIGVGECQPTEVEIQTLNACHPAGAAFGLRKGTEVVLDENEETQELLVGICCSVAPAWRDAPAVTVIDAGSADVNMQRIDTLVRYTRLITLNGKTYRLVISTW